MTRASSRPLVGALIVAVAAGLAFAAQEPTPDRRHLERWEYLQLAPANTVQSVDANGPRRALEACQARTGHWYCREFAEGDRTDPLADALQSLGAEGWEMVSATPLSFDRSIDSVGLTYVFKRRLPDR